MHRTCFSIMPFDDRFDDIDRIIGDAAGKCGLDYVRGDRRHQPGSILPQIKRDIERAAVIVADISEHNPNVLYELGIAHHVRGPERVVILTQTLETIPFDVQEYRLLQYKHSEAGRTELRAKLPPFLDDALKLHDEHEHWNIIPGRVQRTKAVLRDLQRNIDNPPPRGFDQLQIRIVAGLSALAICDEEPPDRDQEPEYPGLLIQERNALREVLARGAHMTAILNPPHASLQDLNGPERLRARFERNRLRLRRLIDLLEGRSSSSQPQGIAHDLAAIAHCQIALTPLTMPNLYIIGNTVAYEGIRRGASRGYGMTHCETNPLAVATMIESFDHLFEQTRLDMEKLHPNQSVLAQLKAAYKMLT